MTIQSIFVTDLISLAILLVILPYIRSRGRISPLDMRLFFWCVLLCGMSVTFDILSWRAEMWTFKGASDFTMLFNTCYSALCPATAGMWLFYVDYKIYGSEKRLRKRVLPYSIPFLINIILVTINSFYPIYFYITPDNRYCRADYIVISFSIAYVYIFLATILVVKNRMKLPRKKFFPLLCFALPAILGGTLQAMFYGISLIWVCKAFSLLIVFISIQNDTASLDSLTGLNNRRNLEELLGTQFQRAEGTELAGIMIDLDDFKKINDKFGHITGDNALEDMSEMLKKSGGRKDYIARYAGDEFVVIFINKGEDAAQKYIASLQKNIDYFNETADRPYKLKFSFGYDAVKRTDTVTSDEFLERIDSQMYEHKKTKASRR